MAFVIRLEIWLRCLEVLLRCIATCRLTCGCIRLFMLSIALLLTLSDLAQGQTPPHGRIEGNTYADPRFGLRYTFPSQLDIQTSLNGMPVGTGEKAGGGSEFLFDAMEKPNGQVRSGVLIVADEKGVIGTTDVRQYLKWILANGMGVKGEPEIKPITVAGRTSIGRMQAPVPLYIPMVLNSQFFVTGTL